MSMFTPTDNLEPLDSNPIANIGMHVELLYVDTPSRLVLYIFIILRKTIFIKINII